MTIVPYIERPPSGPLDPTIALLGEPEGVVFDFLRGKAWIVDKTNPANTMLRDIGDVLTNSGGSATKWTTDADGVQSDRPWWACDHAADGTPLGTRTEEQRVRLSKYPTDFANDVWLKGKLAIEYSQGKTPLSNIEAVKIVTDNGSGSIGPYGLREYSASYTDGNVYTICAIFKDAGAGFGVLGISNGAGYTLTTSFNLQTAQVASSGTHPDVAISDPIGKVTRLSEGWLLCSSTFTIKNGGRAGGIHVCCSTQATTNPYARTVYGNGVDGILVAAAWVEEDAFPTSPILSNEAAAVTRAADLPQIVTDYLPFNVAAGTLFLQGMAYDYDNGAENAAFGFQGPHATADFIRLAKQDVTHRNAYAFGSMRIASASSGSPEGVTLNIEKTFPVSPNPGVVAMSWDDNEQIVASSIVNEFYVKSRPNWPAYKLSRLQFRPANGIMWYQRGIYVPRKATGSEMLQKFRNMGA